MIPTINLEHGDESALLTYLGDLEAHFEERESDVLAYVPEDRRFERLQREARALLVEYPEPAKRPKLFGVPVGVKDIFHVDGFVTRAGSEVPAELLQVAEAESVRRLNSMPCSTVGVKVSLVW